MIVMDKGSYNTPNLFTHVLFRESPQRQGLIRESLLNDSQTFRLSLIFSSCPVILTRTPLKRTGTCRVTHE